MLDMLTFESEVMSAHGKPNAVRFFAVFRCAGAAMVCSLGSVNFGSVMQY